MKKFFLVYLFLVCISSLAYGEEGYAFRELYEVQVELKGTDRASISEGMKTAFKNLMLTLSSNSKINTYPAVVKAVKDSEQYIGEYRLSSEDDSLLATFSFNGEEVRKLLSENSLPLWIGIKPKVLLFLPCKSDSFLIVDEKEILLRRQEICTRAQLEINSWGLMRNIIFIEPVLDLVDLKYLDLYEPRSDQEFLNKISLRYSLKDWMVCYIQDEYGILITEPYCQSPLSDFKKMFINEMVESLADELFKDFQINIDSNIRSELLISVSGVEQYKDLRNVERIIESNALVDEFSIGSISDDTVTYLLIIRGQVSDLEKLMNVNPVLINDPSNENGIDLKYFYQAER